MGWQRKTLDFGGKLKTLMSPQQMGANDRLGVKSI